MSNTDRRFHGSIHLQMVVAIAAATAILCSTSFGQFPGVSSLSFNSVPVFSSKAMNSINTMNNNINKNDNDNDNDNNTNINTNNNKNNINRQATTTATAADELSSWSGTAGDSALRQVQFLAATVSESTETSVETNTGDSMLGTLKSRFLGRTRDRIKIKRQAPGSSNGSNNINGSNSNANTNSGRNTNSNAFGRTLSSSSSSTNNGVFDNQNNRVLVGSSSKRNEQVWAALSNLEQDMQLLDNLAGQKPQLTALELIMLSASVTAASSSPWIMGGQLTEVLPPTAAACK